jgi:hypothetical protein
VGGGRRCGLGDAVEGPARVGDPSGDGTGVSFFLVLPGHSLMVAATGITVQGGGVR